MRAICSVCGATNTTRSQACLQCGGMLSLNAPKKVFRRNFLIAGGALLTGCVAINDVKKYLSGPLFPDKHLFFEMDWSNWVDFAWLPGSRQLLCLKMTGDLAVLDIARKRLSYLNQRAWHGDLSNSLARWSWSNDRKHLAYTQYSGGLTIFIREDGKLIQLLTELPVLAVSWSPDGNQLACLSREDVGRSMVSVWEIQDGKLIWKKEMGIQAGSQSFSRKPLLVWSPDGKCINLAFSESSMFFVWRALDGWLLWKQEFYPRGEVMLLSWSADSRALATSVNISNSGYDNHTILSQMRVWNSQTGQKLFESQIVENDTFLYPKYWIKPFAWSPAGANLAFFLQDHGRPVMQIWDMYSGKHLFSSQPISANPGSISWSPDGRMIAAGCYVEPVDSFGNIVDYGSRSTIQFWSTRNGQALISYDAPRRPTSLTWSPDSSFLAATNMQTYGGYWRMFGYGFPGDGVGSQTLPSALQIFQAPNL